MGKNLIGGNEQIETITTIILSVTTTLLGAIVVGLYKDTKRLRSERKNKNEGREEAMRIGMCSVLREHLVKLHAEATSQGYITRRQRERWEEMFKSYHALGGNGMITDMNDEIRDLPIK
ncbi:hypothetical protein ACWG0P_07055 [Amedibacillus sp. YH-ame6]